MKLNKAFLFFALFLLLVPMSVSAEQNSAVIYYNVACTMCAGYLDDSLIPLLESNGITQIEKKDYVNNKEYRNEFNSESQRFGIPMSLQGHFATFINERIFLEGHIPEQVVIDLLKPENQEKFEKIIVLQDEMREATHYKVWAFKGEIKEYEINTPITEYLDWFNESKDLLETPPELLKSRLSADTLLPLVLVSGFLDGINPCAFAVLLFFIAFLFTLKRSKKHVLKMGLAYISMIFLAYLLIGLGLMQAFALFSSPHLFGKIGAILIGILALLNLIDVIWPGKGLTLRLPSVTKEITVKWIDKGTLPAVMVLGFLVGLCTFPCSGGIYVAILALLSTQTSYLEGLSYLLIYNFMFVLPLLITLALASSKRIAAKLEQMNKKSSKLMKLISAIVMLALAVILWIYSM
jgi:cytochrome c biogenesis protein CcdA